MALKQGTDELVLVRKAGEARQADKVMWATEVERETERDSDTEATMDGSVTTGGTVESTVTVNCYMDSKDELTDEIEDAAEEAISYEMWIINKKVKNTEGKYKAEYRQGYFNSITRTNEADGLAEFEVEFGVYLTKIRGWATLPTEIEKNKAKYGFHDTIESDPANDGLVGEDEMQNIPQPDDSESETV